MLFAIFLELNEFSDIIAKIFVGAGGVVTCPYKSISRGGSQLRPPLQFVGAGDAATRPYKLFSTFIPEILLNQII